MRCMVAVHLIRVEGRQFFILGITLSFLGLRDDSACDNEKPEEEEDGEGLCLENS